MNQKILLSKLLQLNHENNFQQLKNQIKLINDCHFIKSNHRDIFAGIKQFTQDNQNVFNLQNLVAIIKLINPNSKISLEDLTQIQNLTIDEKEYLTQIDENLKTKIKINFFKNLQKTINNLNPLKLNEADLQKLSTKVFEMQNQLITTETSFGNEFKKFFTENDTLEKLKQNSKQNTYQTVNYPNFNYITNGIANSDLVVYSAESGFGKSTFALNLMFELSNHSFKTKGFRPNILMMNYEMSGKQLIQRIMSMQLKKNLTDVINAKFQTQEVLGNNDLKTRTISKQFENLKKLAGDFDKYNFGLDLPIYNSDISYIESFARRKKLKNELDVLIIDHLHLLKDSRTLDNLTERTDSIVWKLRLLSLELQIPIVLLAQFNKESSKEEKTKTMHSFKGSSGIAQHATMVFTFENSSEINENPEITNVELTIHKNRNGKNGTINFEFNKSVQTFTEKGVKI